MTTDLNFKIEQLLKENEQLKSQLSASKRELDRLREIEKDLEESNQRFGNVFHSAQDAILLIDGEIFVDANDATVRMLGYSNRHDFLNSHPSKLSPEIQPDGRQSFEKAQDILKNVFATGFQRFEWVHTKANGENFPVEVSLTPITYKGKTILHCLWRDLTKAKKIERDNYLMQKEIQQKEIMLIQASKMATLGEMAGGIAHEINNPLTIIIGYLKVLELELKRTAIPLSNRVFKIIGDLNSTVMRISKIIHGLHAFAREKKLDKTTSVSVKDLIQTTISFCTEKFKNHDVDFRIEEISQEIFVQGNETQLSQVLLNLLNNAYDAISLQDKKWIEINTHVDSKRSRVELRVKDNGPGVPEEIREKIMNPFFTTKQSGGGTGLGLSISHGIIKQHKGDLFLDTSCEETCFVMSLPAQGV